MSDLYPVAGCRIYIGDAPMATQNDDLEESDFNGVSWTEIDGWQTAGAIGDNAQLITAQLINRGRDYKQKGTANAGSMQNVFAIVPNDAGQTALRAAGAASNKNNYPFKILLNDPTGSPATASKRLFIGLVMSAQETMGDANTIQNLSATIEINSNIIAVAAGE